MGALIRMRFLGDQPETVNARLKAIAKIPKDKTEQVKILAPGATVLGAAIRQNIETKLNEGARTGKWPATGTLRDSVTTRFISKDAAVEVGPEGVVYARIHEFGGTVHAKNFPFLVFYIEYDDGRKVRFLKKSVTIPPRPYVLPALTENEGAILAAMGAAMAQRIKIAVNRSAS